MNILDKDITYLKSLTPQKIKLLNKELHIYTYGDLLYYLPFRYEDRTRFYTIQQLHANMPYLQTKGRLTRLQTEIKGRRRILTATLQDETGTLQLIWFNGVTWLQKYLCVNQVYTLWGKPSSYQGKTVIIHPELTSSLTANPQKKAHLQPIYPTTQALTKAKLHARGIAMLQKYALAEALPQIQENLPDAAIQAHNLVSRQKALHDIHFPSDQTCLAKAQQRRKFEEVCYLQLRIRQGHGLMGIQHKSLPFHDTKLVKSFYEKLPFSLTSAQKKVIKTIYQDMKSGRQMHRLLQGDVGCGKTIVAFIAMLLPIAHQTQVAFMAPTEILAQQHFNTLQQYAKSLHLHIALLTGSTKAKERKKIAQQLCDGTIQIIVGTHALISDNLQFHTLGLAVIDEQHRFGVAQRAKLHQKASQPPHILVMTATPIPRTLAMTLYSHLDLSVIHELPPNRPPVKTYHLYDANRLRLFSFMQKKIEEGRQIYMVYPRIEHSKTDTYKDVMDGYESITRHFTKVPCSILHGRMKPANKAYEMARFAKGETKIMVASTVIEVGVNVPNATVMVIENAEKFGLAQLHQLRGRIVRSHHPSHCILMTSKNLSAIPKKRIQTMVATHDGFKIANLDLELRGPGDITGLVQSGMKSSILDFARDYPVIEKASAFVKKVLAHDPLLTQPEHTVIQQHLQWLHTTQKDWLNVS